MKLLFEFGLTSGIVISIILTIIQFADHRNKQLLLLRLGIFVLILFHFVSFYSVHYQLKPLFLLSELIVGPGNLILGPLILVYALVLTENREKATRKYGYHFLPSLMYWSILTVPLVFLHFQQYYQGLEQEALLPQYLEAFLGWDNYFFVGTTLFSLGYLWFGFRHLRAYEALKKQTISSLDREVKWAYRLIIGLMSYHVIDIGLTLGMKLAGYDFAGEDYWLVIISLGILVYLGVKLLLPLRLSSHPIETIKEHKTKPIRTIKASAAFSNAEVERIQAQLIFLMEEECMYQQADLSLMSLANRLELSPKKLSYFLNEHIGKNFYEFINAYRVASFQLACIKAENKHLSLWGIANQSGFRSKTSFNRIFKNQTGLTPSEYYRQNSPQ